MTLQEYIDLAARTCPDLGEKNNKYHMKMGVFTEVAEVVDIIKKHIAYGKPIDTVHLGEEIGDIMWYVANQIRMNPDSPILFSTILEKNLSSMAVLYKHACYSWSSLIMVVRTLLSIKWSVRHHYWTFYLCVSLCKYFELDLEQICTTNINKLKARYPDKFSNEAALNRNLDKERGILEDGLG